ncbi:ATP-binding protein [Reyranella sp.]|uniref:ATP-binding protein n=1 Tax=Reyranella sp. TaxID=1929291 RepID=UPI003D14C7F6
MKVRAAVEPPSAEHSFSFDGFCLIPRRQLLLRDGERVRIGGRALDILTLLVERAGELVSNADLEAHVWPETFVHASNLKVHIVLLRRILREASGDPQAIVNVPGRGYRFTRPVARRGRAAPVSGRPRKSVRRAFDALPRLFGREEEIGRLMDALSAHPLVSIVGAGGVGKTTLALATAARLGRRFEAPTCFVDFSSLDDPQHVVQSITAELGLRADPGDPLGSIADHLRATPRLLILDNCEHLAAAIAAALERLAAGLQGSAILATSREPLRTRMEHVLRLAPLACPADTSRIAVAEALLHPAVALFVARAGDCGTFSLRDDEEAASVSRICRRLDGLPLAIELAAKRLGTMRPAELLQRLQDGLDAVGWGDAAVPARQRTLTATLDWSYRLLSAPDSLILRFVAVFAREFATADAVALLAPLGLSEADILAGLESIASKSFATVELRQGQPCYRLFESVRHYGIAQLDAGGERERARLLHARHLLEVVERAEEEWEWQVAYEWVGRHGARLDDLRHAIAWAFGPTGTPSMGVRLTAAAIPLWEELCSVDEARLRVAHALDVARSLPDCDVRLKAKLALRHAWTLTWSQVRLPETAVPWTECLDLARAAGDSEYELRALWGLATYETFTGRTVAAIDHLRAFDALAERTGDPSVQPDGQRLLALARAYVGEVRQADEALERLAHQVNRFEKQARVTRFSIDRYCIIRSSLAFTQWLRGCTRSSLAAATQAVEAAVALDHPVSLANSLVFAGVPLALWTGQLDRAEAGLALLRTNRAIRNTSVWPRLARFFEASLGHARGERAAVASMRTALDELLETGFVTRAPMYIAMLAEALLEQGRLDEAGARLDDAERRLALYGERWCHPELLRLRGRVEVARGEGQAAERLFEAAIGEASALGTLSFELRAACDLARSLAARGCRDAAMGALTKTSARFTEAGPETEVGSVRSLMENLR